MPGQPTLPTQGQYSLQKGRPWTRIQEGVYFRIYFEIIYSTVPSRRPHPCHKTEVRSIIIPAGTIAQFDDGFAAVSVCFW